MSDRHAAGVIPYATAHGASVGNQELTLCVVILMIALASGEQKGTLEIPARVGTEFKPCTRQERLGDRVLCVLHSPCSKILGESCNSQAAAKFSLQSDIARSAEILLHEGMKEKVADRVTGDQGRASPG